MFNLPWRRALLVILCASAAMSPASSFAKSGAPAYLPLGGAIDAPRGFVDMCRSTREFCSATKVESDADIVTGALAASARQDSPASDRQYAAASTLSAMGATSLSMVAVSALSFAADQTNHAAAPAFCDLNMQIGSRSAPYISLASMSPFDGTALRGENSILNMLAARSFVRDTLPGSRSDRVIFTPPSYMRDIATTICAGHNSAAVAPTPRVETQPAVETHVVRGAMPADPLRLLKRVNRFVNQRVRQRTDYQIFARDELWTRSGVGPGAQGDCEDIAIEKRHELIAEGFPADRLAFGVVFSVESGLHTILIAKTPDGDMVLDSRSPYVRRWSDVPYSWISVQSTRDPMIWERIQPV